MQKDLKSLGKAPFSFSIMFIIPKLHIKVNRYINFDRDKLGIFIYCIFLHKKIISAALLLYYGNI